MLVGRPNVGKSTLFNRVTRTRRAIVTPVPGTTRDVLTQPVEWEGTRFELTDTGGMFGASEDPLHELVLERGRRAIGDADLLVLVVDGREGLAGGDREIAQAVREAGKPALLAINKIDDRRARDGALEMYQLGFDPVFEIAAEHAQQWRSKLGVSVLLVHHTNASGNRERGHSAMRGAADFMISMTPADDVVILECSKQRNGPPFDTITLKLTPVQGGGCVFRLASDVLPSQGLTTAQAKVLGVLRDTFAAEGATKSEWQRVCQDIPERTFHRACKALVERGFVKPVGTHFRATGGGR